MRSKREGAIEMNKKKFDGNGNGKDAQRRVQRNDGFGTADWTACNAKLLAETVAIVAASGGALRLVYTRDGGAYAIGFYGDGDTPYTEYVRPSEDVDSYLEALKLAWGGN